MAPKNWTRFVVVLAFALAVSIFFFRSWTPLGVPLNNHDSKRHRRSSKPPLQRSFIRPPERPGQATHLHSTATAQLDDPKDFHFAHAPETFPHATLRNLITDTEDPDWAIRWNAVNELGKLKDSRAIPSLLRRVLYDDNTHPRWRSLWALKAVDPTGSEAIPPLRDALLDPDEVVRRNAAIGLAFFGQPEARDELLAGLDDRDAFRRWEAAFSLQDIGSNEIAQALAPLLDAAIEPDLRVRSQVALTLGYMGSEEVILPLLNALRTDESPEVRARAAMTLAEVGNLFFIADLEAVMPIERDPQVKKYINNALTEIRKRNSYSRTHLERPQTTN